MRSNLIWTFGITVAVGAWACQPAPEDGDGQQDGLGGSDSGSGGQASSSGGQQGQGTGGALGGQGGSSGDDPLFAVMYEVYEPNGDSNSYLNLLSDLDIEEVDPGVGREYAGGRAFVQTHGGKVFVGDAASPTVTRFSVGPNGLIEEDSISFANFGLTTGQFDSWNVTFLSPEKAYLMDFTEGTTIVWNPASMQIVGEIPAPDEFLREGWQFESSPAAVRGDVLFRTVSWANYDTVEHSQDFLLVTFDLENDEIIDMVPETRCPTPGNLVHTDEEGNIYFSNWVWPVAGAIMWGATDPCVLRINADEDGFDQDWTLRYQDVTDGHQGAMFTYLGDGQALVSAFYEERTSYDDETNPWNYVGSKNWRLWNVDMTTLESSLLEGLDYSAGAFTPAVLDGRQYLMVPGGDEENWATQIYEIVDGVAEPRAKLPGWSYQIVQVR